MPESFDYGEANNYVVYEEMLLCHFENLFEYDESYEQLINDGWEIKEESALEEVIKYYFDLKKCVQFIDNELSQN